MRVKLAICCWVLGDRQLKGAARLTHDMKFNHDCIVIFFANENLFIHNVRLFGGLY